MNTVYITKSTSFLPNNPIAIEEMEDYLGEINNRASRAKNLVLRNNGIKTRYYALDKQGKSTHSNAELTCNSITLLENSEFNKNDIEYLACGTSSPDTLMPSHAVMVHGELKNKSIEVVSPSGVCCAGMHAFKSAYFSVLTGNTNNAVCTGSEKASTWLRSEQFNTESEKLMELENSPIIAFEKDFLRFMLSDGAGAFLLESKPVSGALKVEWIEVRSYANELDLCMYAGTDKVAEGSKPWRDFQPKEWLDNSVFAMKQDTKLLGENIVEKGAVFLKELVEKHNVNLDKVSYFLPHLSSMYFKPRIAQKMIEHDIEIKEEKWFTNLQQVGNVGSASIYLMVNELMESGKLKSGEKILLMVPESARFSYAYCMLTVC